jgi:hypothetical protein
VTWGLLGGSVIENYLEGAQEEKFRHIAEQAVQHNEADTAPSGAIYHMIRNSDHAYIEWKSKLELLMKEQYHMTKKCDYAFGESNGYNRSSLTKSLTLRSPAKEDFFFERVALAFPQASSFRCPSDGPALGLALDQVL